MPRLKVFRHIRRQGWGMWVFYVKANVFHWHHWESDQYDLPGGGWIPAGWTCSKCDGNSGPNKPRRWSLFHDYP